MTIEEKKLAIEKYCDSKMFCVSGEQYPCPLYGFDCELDRADSSTVDKFFKLVSAMPDYKDQEETQSAVNHPSHYNQGGIECIDAMVSAFGKQAVSSFCLCNAFKYIWRADHKNGLEDIEKANWYINKYKELTADEAV